MRASRLSWALAFASLAAIGCSTPAGTDAGDVQQIVDSGGVLDVTDSGTDVHRDVAADGPSAAGNRCMVDNDCGPGFQCLLGFVEGGLCTHTCTNSVSPATEARMCGAGATCVSQGDSTAAPAYCEHACDPTAGTAACRTGFVCTGWWFEHANGVADATGCWTFCSANSDCPSGSVCDLRAGSCETTAPVVGTRADGQPCTPVMMGRSTECRGLCFSVDSADPTHGICGSLINTAVTPMCPDDPTHIRQGGGTADNVGLCLYRNCDTDCDCPSPLVCTPVTGGTGNVCDYPSTTSTGIPCGGDGGVDGSADASSDVTTGDTTGG